MAAKQAPEPDSVAIKEMEDKLHYLAIQSQINFPRGSVKCANGMADMSKVVYRHIMEQRWRKEGALDLLMERIHQMHVVPDVVPDIHPSFDLRVSFPEHPTNMASTSSPALEPPGSNPPKVFRFGIWIRNLDLSLVWQPRLDAIHTRRILSNVDISCWPSWAWSGWKGAVQYRNELQILDGVVADPHGAPVESLITDWHPADEDGTIVQLDIMDIPPSWIVDQVSADAPFKYVAPQGCPSHIILDFVPPTGILIFRSMSKQGYSSHYLSYHPDLLTTPGA
ncbi:hypothetical protein V8E55_001045 [Tylopilus felleus]